ncbi:MAG: methionyl-tRNA formyltransferase, partial [Chlamydiia bacterium]|nr:methionyl-tRNA formyltransferase [Chlamydiia bacterium]
VPLIRPEMLEIDWTESAEKIHNQIRAFSPKPGAWCWVEIRGKAQRLKILRSQVSSEAPTYQKDRWVVPCGEGSLSLLEVQLEGKKRLSISDFTRGFQEPPKPLD